MKFDPITLLIEIFNIHINNMSFQRVNAQIWWPMHKDCSFIDCCSIAERGNIGKVAKWRGIKIESYTLDSNRIVN